MNRPPDATLLKWRAAMPPGFEFTIKAWQLIIHGRTSSTCRRLKQPLREEQRGQLGGFKNTEMVHRGWERPLACAELLRATAILFQCPASFRPTLDNIRNLRGFFKRVKRPSGIQLMWEPRGEWPATKRRAICRELELTHVVDPFVTRAVTSSPTAFRLHGLGSGDPSDSDGELEELLGRVPKRGECEVMFNNIPRVADSKRFMALLQR
jgi:uncharacterized protein YecE (DUF72 family)